MISPLVSGFEFPVYFDDSSGTVEVSETLTAYRKTTLDSVPASKLRLAALACKSIDRQSIIRNFDKLGHVTLFGYRDYRVTAAKSKFLKISPIEDVRSELFQKLPSDTAPNYLDVELGDVVVLGSSLSPVLGVSVHSSELVDEYAAINNALTDLGEIDVRNNFLPHISFARLRKNDPDLIGRAIEVARQYIPNSIMLRPVEIDTSV